MISGALVSDGGSPVPPEFLSQMRLYARIQSKEQPGIISSPVFRISSDGSFVATGLTPGRAQLSLTNLPPGFTQLRVEQNGAPAPIIDLTSGQSVSGVQIVVAYGGGTVHGTIRLEGGELPAGMRVVASLLPLKQNGQNGGSNLGAVVDLRSQFTFRSVPAGDYILTASFTATSVSGPRLNIRVTQQPNNITDGADQSVVLTATVVTAPTRPTVKP